MNENMIAMVERNQKAVSDLETKMEQLQRLLDAGQNDAAENMMQELLALKEQLEKNGAGTPSGGQAPTDEN